MLTFGKIIFIFIKYKNSKTYDVVIVLINICLTIFLQFFFFTFSNKLAVKLNTNSIVPWLIYWTFSDWTFLFLFLLRLAIFILRDTFLQVGTFNQSQSLKFPSQFSMMLEQILIHKYCIFLV